MRQVPSGERRRGAAPPPSPAVQSPLLLSRRAFLRLAALAGAGAALSSCARSAAEGTAPAQIVYQDWRTDWFPPMAQEMLAQFHAAHADIRVYYVPDPESLADRMLSDLQAGTAPDVFQGDAALLASWARRGYLLDLRPFTAGLSGSTLKDWDAAQYGALFSADGLQFALPKCQGALAVYYNKDLCDRYGVDYPGIGWRYEDYADAMQRLTHNLDGDGQTDLWGSALDVAWPRIQAHVNGWGGHFVDPEDPGRCLMAAPAAMAAIDWLRARIWDDGVMTTRAALAKPLADAFVDGKVAMIEETSRALRSILGRAPFRVGVVPFPLSGRPVSMAPTDAYAIYAGTRHPEAAWELVRFLTGPDYGLAMARADLLQPARASLIDAWTDLVRSEFPQATRDLDLLAFTRGQRQGYSVTPELFAHQTEAERLALGAWEQILVRGQAPLEHMFGVSRQIESAQEEAAP